MTNERLNAGRRIALNAFRKRACPQCGVSFLPIRTDAEFCSSRCRQAAHRRRDARAKAESLFETQQQAAQSAHDVAMWREHYRDWAKLANAEVVRLGVDDVRYAGTSAGVLGVEAMGPSAPRENWPPGASWWRSKEIEHRLYDAEVAEAVAEILRDEALGGPFIEREYLKECRALLRGPVRKISIFVDDRDWDSSHPTKPLQFLPDFDDGDDLDDSESGHDDLGNAVADLLAGGGYRTFKA